MRPSCYLNAVEIGDGTTLLYNGFSMCMDVVPSEIARGLLSSGEGSDFSFLMPAEREHLLKRGHLTTLTAAGEQDELRAFVSALAERESGLNGPPFSRGTITFVLTYQCNLSCSYCYQQDVRKSAGASAMDAGFIDGFFSNYLYKLLPREVKDDLSFLLYGGEPMLPGNRGAIERILHYAKDRGAGVSTVTNAVMLPKMLDLIGPEKGKINNIQVTLDGGPKFHDEQRRSESGAPTFEQTIFAVREVMKTGAHAIIRIHLHPERLESARALVEYLEREKILGRDRVSAYFWSTEDFQAKVLSPREYDLFSRLFQEVALKQNRPPTAHFAFLRQTMDMKTLRIQSIRRHCETCVAGLHCVVDSLGDIYECIDDAGRRERRIGSLAGGEIAYFNRGKDYRKLHLREKPECLKCSIALYCGGGCINRMKTPDGDPSSPFCLQVREFIGQTLKSCFLLNRNGASE